MRRTPLLGAFGGTPTQRLQLTSMVDMLTILIVFLLQSFSDDGSLLSPAPGVELPIAASGERPGTAVSIEVTEYDIRLDGTRICSATEVRTSGNPTIPPLAAALERLKSEAGAAGGENAWRDGGGSSDSDVIADGKEPGVGEVPRESTPGDAPMAGARVLIQCDRSREFATLKKVLRTCSEAGYDNPGLLVERSGS